MRLYGVTELETTASAVEYCSQQAISICEIRVFIHKLQGFADLA